jgi:hypothetical protein
MQRTTTVLYLLLIILSVKCVPDPRIKVVGIVEIFRHGARAPHTEFSNTKKLYFGSRRTQLTINGFRQHILLGRWLRRRYVFGDIYKLFDENHFSSKKDIVIYSSPTQRTIFSVAAHILGLFPQITVKLDFYDHDEIKTNDIPPIFKFKEKNKDNEILINVINPNKNSLFKALRCRRPGGSRILYEEVEKKDIYEIGFNEMKLAVNDILKNYGDFYKNKDFERKYLTKQNKYSAQTLNNLGDVLRQYNYHNQLDFSDLKLSDLSINTLKKNRMNYFYNHRLEESKYKKLYVSRMFRMISDYLEKIIKGKGHEKMLIFSGHDSNVSDVIGNLMSPQFLRETIFKGLKSEAAYNFIVPPLASSILIEIIQEVGHDDDYFIRFYYDGEEITKNFMNNIDYNDDLGALDFHQFKDLLISRIDEDYTKLKCKKNN